MMALFWQGLLLAILVAAMSVNADMKVDCRPDYVTLVWRENRNPVDPSHFRLGNCLPTSFSGREVIFTVGFNDCNFRRLVTGNQLIHSNDLMHISSPDSHELSFTHQVVCSYERPKDWYPPTYNPVFNTFGQGAMVFHIGLMNEDFSGPAESTSFPLGSFIPIMASVELQSHQPLLLLLDECVAAATPELNPGSDLYPIITNKGCLVDSKTSRSKFEPRQKSSEIQLSLQAFKFAIGKEVYLHCQLVAWDPVGLDHTKKACNYIKNHGWELVDNPAYSNLCDCCDSTCKSRKMRSTASGKLGLVKKAVLGPFTITENP
ncbi:zona pellucida sperm-binding protein 3-like [Pleuronectes platessa]|uniref:zona pellucida sperm-binding protein 3-like n=1 Tax=Pleuronectes platessa TaxID=8262 RepID=UPI00232A3EEC|nr:zona pellucida sperm-binding protein 3-like [Pleuronectes platessa]